MRGSGFASVVDLGRTRCTIPNTSCTVAYTVLKPGQNSGGRSDSRAKSIFSDSPLPYSEIPGENTLYRTTQSHERYIDVPSGFPNGIAVRPLWIRGPANHLLGMRHRYHRFVVLRSATEFPTSTVHLLLVLCSISAARRLADTSEGHVGAGHTEHTRGHVSIA